MKYSTGIVASAVRITLEREIFSYQMENMRSNKPLCKDAEDFENDDCINRKENRRMRILVKPHKKKFKFKYPQYLQCPQINS